MRPQKPFLFLLLLLVCTLPGFGQVFESAVGSRPHLWAGVEGSDFNPDYNFYRVYGIGVYGDYYLKPKLGVEAEIRLLDLNKPRGLTQKTFLAGPTYTFLRYHRFSGYGKVLLGASTMTFPNNIGYGSYFAFEPGGGVEYRLAPRWKLRGEYDYQFWPSAPGFTSPGFPSRGLTPAGYSGGLSYRIF